jgi:integrase
MANLGQKNGVFHVRFRFRGKEYKKSLKTSDESAAQAARHVIELTIHRLHTGQIDVPYRVDPGDFIVSGGTLHTPIEPPPPRVVLPSVRQVVDEYSKSVKDLLAPSYHYSQAMHLRHLLNHLGTRADVPIDTIGFRDLDQYLKARLQHRHPNTAERERITLMQFCNWAVRQSYLRESPAAGLSPIKGGDDRPPFRTIAEISRIAKRGGLADAEVLDLWECLYLSPAEIASLLATVRANARVDYSYLLHAIPAYTGMRRGEVLRLRWVDVDLDDGYVTARSRKQSRRKRETARRIDLHTELKKELNAWREKRPRGQYVICEPNSLEPINNDRANRCFWQPMRHTDWCLSNAKDWFKVGFHTYRHSFASNMASAGVDQRVIDEFMGHQTEAMRKRYRHLFPRDRRAAIESFSLVQQAGPVTLVPSGAVGRSENTHG